jgi:hypothetical protein
LTKWATGQYGQRPNAPSVRWDTLCALFQDKRPHDGGRHNYICIYEQVSQYNFDPENIKLRFKILIKRYGVHCCSSPIFLSDLQITLSNLQEAGIGEYLHM